MSSEAEREDVDVDEDEFDDTDDDSYDEAESFDDSDDDGTDNVGDSSVEINVEQLIADFEENNAEVSARRKEVRRRLEELAERKMLDDTYAIDFDDD